jgi:hypothetical protein
MKPSYRGSLIATHGISLCFARGRPTNPARGLPRRPARIPNLIERGRVALNEIWYQSISLSMASMSASLKPKWWPISWISTLATSR